MGGGILQEFVIDSNVVFDLHAGRVLGMLFRLDHVFTTTNLVTAEFKTVGPGRLEKFGLRIIDLTGGQTPDLSRLRRQYKGPSIQDLSALVLARDTGAILLTRDTELREAAIDEGVESRDTLWVMKELVSEQVLPKREAAEALRQMVRMRRGFPRLPAEMMIKQWTS